MPPFLKLKQTPLLAESKQHSTATMSTNADADASRGLQVTPTPSAIESLLASKTQRFFAKRAPRADASRLTLRNVYIFLSRSGVMYALLLLITFVTGINYGNNLVLGLCFYLASIWVIGFHLTFSHIFGLNIRLLNAPLVKAGQIGWVTIELVNNKAQPSRQLHLAFDHRLQNAAVPQNGADRTQQAGFLLVKNLAKTAAPAVTEAAHTVWQQHGIAPYVHLTSLQGSLQLRLPIMTYQRGRLQLPRLVISTVYPMGIMRAWSYLYFATPVWVYPKPMSFDLQASQVLNSQDEQEFSAHTSIGQNDFESLDEYSEGESLARVSWAHLARGQGMLTKHFADPMGQEQLLDYRAMPAPLHEDKLSQLAYAVLTLANTNDAFQLNLPGDIGSVGQGATFIDACLLRLAQCP